MEEIMLLVLIVLLSSLILLALVNKYIPYKWFCNFWGWHLDPRKIVFGGCSAIGECPRCRKSVLQDGQGNWF